MPQPIVLPMQQRKTNPFWSQMQNLFGNLLMMQARAGMRGRETEETRKFQLGLAGYTPIDETGMQIKERAPETPAVTVGEQGYRAPKVTVETKKLPTGQTAYFLKQGPRTTGFSVSKAAKSEKGKLFVVQTPEGPKYYEHTAEGTFKPTDLKAPPKGGKGKETISDEKLKVWRKYIKNKKVTKEEGAFIGIDKDPFLAEAADAVRRDPKFAWAPVDKQVSEIIRMADTLRQATTQKITGAPTPKVVDPLGLFQ